MFLILYYPECCLCPMSRSVTTLYEKETQDLPIFMIVRVRRKKWVGTSSSRVITSNGIKDFRERQIQIQRQERS